MEQEKRAEKTQADAHAAARRRFLVNCGKFAVVTPPVVSLMLSASERSYATVGSGGGRGARGNNGFGNGGNDPAPGNSGSNNSPNSGQKADDIVR